MGPASSSVFPSHSAGYSRAARSRAMSHSRPLAHGLHAHHAQPKQQASNAKKTSTFAFRPSQSFSQPFLTLMLSHPIARRLINKNTLRIIITNITIVRC